MTFSSDAKKELLRVKLISKVEALLELSALSRMNATVIMNREGIALRFFTEHRDVMERISQLCEFLYGVRIPILQQKNDQLQKRPLYYAYLEGEQAEQFFQQSGTDWTGRFVETVSKMEGRLRKTENGCAYLRGAFLGGGSVVDPEKSYHLEMLLPSEEDLSLLRGVLSHFEMKFGTTTRGQTYVVYLKDSDVISDFLVLIGATNAMLRLEDAKARKTLHNDINRKINAETANIDKSLDASFRQISAIEWLAKTVGLDNLPAGLSELAYARLRNPEANFRVLGELVEPAISKSGVNHRMSRLIKVAEENGWKEGKR